MEHINNYVLDIPRLARELNDKIKSECETRNISKYRLLRDGIGISHTTIKKINGRREGLNIRLDVFLIVVNWLGTDPKDYWLNLNK